MRSNPLFSFQKIILYRLLAFGHLVIVNGTSSYPSKRFSIHIRNKGGKGFFLYFVFDDVFFFDVSEVSNVHFIEFYSFESASFESSAMSSFI